MSATAQVIPMGNEAAWRKWKKLIEASWQKGVESIIETGQHLIDAKNDPKMKHGSWEAMIAMELPFKPATARRLMLIAAHPIISNRSHVNVLPPYWGTLYELTTVDNGTLKSCIKDGTINPKMERKEVRALKKTKPKKSKPNNDAAVEAFAAKFKDRDWRTKAEMMLRLLDHLGIEISHLITVHPKASKIEM